MSAKPLSPETAADVIAAGAELVPTGPWTAAALAISTGLRAAVGAWADYRKGQARSVRPETDALEQTAKDRAKRTGIV